MLTLPIYYTSAKHKQAKRVYLFCCGFPEWGEKPKKLPVPTENTIFHHSRGNPPGPPRVTDQQRDTSQQRKCLIDDLP